jgi:hypothetical protein
MALALVAAFILGSVSFASAAELKVSGEFKSNAQWSSQFDLNDENNSEDEFNIKTRARIIFRYSASDNLSAVLRIQYGTMYWGDPNTGGLIDTDSNTNMYLKRAYLEFKWPETSILFQAGKLSLALPNQFGSPIVGADATAFVVSAPLTDMVSLAAGFARAIDLNPKSDGDNPVRDEWDHIFLAAPLTFDGLELTPYVDFSIQGNGVPVGVVSGTATPLGVTYDDDYVYPWWAGLSMNLSMLDPLILKGDFYYGMITDGEDVNERQGWMADLELSYTGLDFMVAKLFGMYASGEDDDIDNGSERMPTIVDDWAMGTFWYGGSDLLDGDLDRRTVGSWTVGLGLTDITFIEKLSHALYVMYISGTNDSELADTGALSFGTDLTTDDYLVEIDFNHKYMIYEQLAAIVELSYLINGYDEDKWDIADRSDAWKIGFGFNYNF